MSAFDWVIQLVYVAAASCFVLGLHLMNSPATARRGNQLSTGGMIAAIAATFAIILHAGTISATGWIVMLAGGLIGGGAGLYAARTVQMTAMPQLVSIFNAVGGGAAALVAIHDYINLVGLSAGVAERITIPTLLDVLIGAVTFSGSIIAAGKLQGLISAAPVTFPGSRAVNLGAAVIAAGASVYLIVTPSVPVLLIVIVAALVVRRDDGAADRRGRHAGGHLAAERVHRHRCRDGRVRHRQRGADHRRGAGRRVRWHPHQADGRRDEPVAAQHHDRRLRHRGRRRRRGGGPRRGRPLDRRRRRRHQLAYAQKVIIVPGYGLAAAQAQHAVAELAALLEERGIEVSYAIHPVAGRMPGHMNVLLAEANVPYPLLKEMDEINPEFPRTDVALVIGANDVTNPAARRAGTAISGMPILDVDHAKSIIVIKRSMASGYAGIDNELYVDPKTSMFFGDAKTALTALTAAVKTLVG